MTITKPSGHADVPFDGHDGEQIFIDVPASTLPNQCGVLQLRDPAGTVLNQGCLIGGSGFIDSTRLTATGRYLLTVAPSDNAAGSSTVRFVHAVDQRQAITLDGPKMTATVAQCPPRTVALGRSVE